MEAFDLTGPRHWFGESTISGHKPDETHRNKARRNLALRLTPDQNFSSQSAAQRRTALITQILQASPSRYLTVVGHDRTCVCFTPTYFLVP